MKVEVDVERLVEVRDLIAALIRDADHIRQEQPEPAPRVMLPDLIGPVPGYGS